MAKSSREIKRRIASITSTQQITRAMEMVAAAKLRRAQQMVPSTRPYFKSLHTSLGILLEAAQQRDVEVPWLSSAGDSHCLIVFTSDRGLAGGYNAAVIRRAEAFLEEHPTAQVVVVGRKARDHLSRKGVTFLAEFVNLGDSPSPRQAWDIAQVVMDFYLHGLFDRISVLYSKFINTVTHEVTLRTVMPIEAGDELVQRGRESGFAADYIYEPSLDVVLESVIPLYFQAAVYESLIEAKASELGARMVAMRNATDNAGELIRELNLSYHRARQAQITKEIAEIVGGADALES